MGNQQNLNKLSWSPTMERYFIDLMLDQMHRGNRLGHTFNKQAWTDMLTMFGRKFGFKYDRDILKSHYSFLWKQYNDLKNLLDKDGFSWDDTRKMVVADASVWDAYVKAHPDAEMFRTKAIPSFNDLCLIYAYTKADGRYSLSSHDIDFDDEIQAIINDAGIIKVGPVPTESSKPDWTAGMDHYFVELMLFETKKGNKNNGTFSKQAWTDMVASFNAKFCSKYGKDFLQQRFQRLSKYYNDLQNLLKQNGFSWDEKRKFIVADDGVWEKYTKMYPDAHSYRNRKLLDYRDLCMIYEITTESGPRTHVSLDKNFKEAILDKKGKEKVSLSSTGRENLKLQWMPLMDRFLTDLLLDQALRGNQIGHTFTDEAWAEMTTMLNTKFGAHYENDFLKHQFKNLRRQYNDIRILLKQNGFYWDDTREMIVAEDYTWNSYIKECPEAELYKNKSVPSYHKLCVIFGEENSNRRHDPLDDADVESRLSDQMNGVEPAFNAENDLCGEYWTRSMDRHLIDLMLQQVHQQNRIGSSFSNETWINMSLSFVDRFGLPYDRDLLKTRHKHFRKLYNDLRNLLNQRGFSWDEKWQMVTAYDSVWDMFIKEYPDAKSYRGKCNPNYNDLFLIYGASPSWINGLAQSMNHNSHGSSFKNGYFRRTDWTPQMDRYFINLMLEQVQEGNMVDQRFNKQAWDAMDAKFVSQFGSQHDKNALKSRFSILRKRFYSMKNLLNQAGFVWDEARQMVIAHSHIWDAYIKEHPNARSFRNRSLPSYNDLFLIYGNRTADGLENYSCLSIDFEYFAPEISIGKGDCQAPSNSPQRIKWTATMESCFIDLMLEQVRRGSKTHRHSFSNQAWNKMIDAFSENFGLFFTKDVLQNQYRRLMMEYNDIKYLLNQNGFAWDGFRQRLMADDDAWEACIKEYPEAIKYKDRNLGTYEDLRMIFSNKSPSSGLEIGITDNNLDTEADAIFGDLQCPGSDFEMPNLRKRRKSSTLPVPIFQRKIPRPNKTPEDYDSIESVVDALQAIPGMNDEIFLQACTLLEDEREAKKFVTMEVGKRRKWLLRKLKR